MHSSQRDKNTCGMEGNLRAIGDLQNAFEDGIVDESEEEILIDGSE